MGKKSKQPKGPQRPFVVGITLEETADTYADHFGVRPNGKLFVPYTLEYIDPQGGKDVLVMCAVYRDMPPGRKELAVAIAEWERGYHKQIGRMRPFEIRTPTQEELKHAKARIQHALESQQRDTLVDQLAAEFGLKGDSDAGGTDGTS